MFMLFYRSRHVNIHLIRLIAIHLINEPKFAFILEKIFLIESKQLIWQSGTLLLINILPMILDTLTFIYTKGS